MNTISHSSDVLIDTRDIFLNEDTDTIEAKGKYSDFKMYVEDKRLFISKIDDSCSDSFPLKDVEAIAFEDHKISTKNIKHPITSKDVFYLDDLDKSIEVVKHHDEDDNDKVSYRIPATLLLTNDFNFNRSLNLTLTKVLGAIGGEVTLDKDNDVIVFTSSDRNNKLMSFRYTVKNSQGHESIEKTPVYLIPSNLPKDENFVDQWYLPYMGITWRYTGKGANIAIFDSGYPLDHEDIHLQNNQTYLINYNHRPNNVIAHLIVTHSLSVAGVIGALRNEKHCIGIAYDASIDNYQIPLGQLQRINFKRFDKKKYDIINNSWGTYSLHEPSITTREFLEELEKIAREGGSGLGTNIVFSVGNQGDDGWNTAFDHFINSPYVIGIGGINKPTHLHFMEREDQDALPIPGPAVLVSAPWVKVQTLEDKDFTIKPNNIGSSDTTINVGGTSFSTPIISGVLAQMKEARPDLGAKDREDILVNTAEMVIYDNPMNKTETIRWHFNGAHHWNGGGLHFNSLNGYGQPDVEAAIKLTETWPLKQTPANLRITHHETPDFKYAKKESKEKVIILDIDSELVIESVIAKITFSTTAFPTLKVNLISPSHTVSPLIDQPFVNPITGELIPDFQDLSFVKNLPEIKDLQTDILSQHFRYESSNGTWMLHATLEHFKDQPPEEFAKAKLEISSFDLEIYAKEEDTPLQLIYTNEFPDLLEFFSDHNATKIIEQRTTVSETSEATILNTAAVDGDVYIDLTSRAPSNIAGVDVTISPSHKLRTVITGDNDDTIYAHKEGATHITASRGTNVIHLSGGNNVLHYPLLGKGEIHDEIYNFSVGTDKLDLNAKCSNHTTEHMDVDSLLVGNNWSIRLVDTHITEEDI